MRVLKSMIVTAAVLTAVLAGPLFAFTQNPALAGLPDTTLYVVPNGDQCPGGPCNNEILAYASMAYDHHRHKVITFGGGHSTNFPSEVVEFDPNTLAWTYLLNPVDCGTAYTSSNALLAGSGTPLGGFRYNGVLYAGSRHTYDGLEIAPDTDILVMGQAMEFKGCAPLSEGTFDAYFKGGSGLFTFNPVSKAWSVSGMAGLAEPYCFSEFDPANPDWLYFGNSGYDSRFWKINWKTFQKVQLAAGHAVQVDHSMTYCPLDRSFYEFYTSDVGTYRGVAKYDISANRWTDMKPSGPAANTYSINVVWDTLNKVFACFDMDTYDFTYYNPLENRWYAVDQNLGLARLFHHHVYDPVNNVHIMVGITERFVTYVYKFSDSPGKYPGTGQTSSLAMAPAARHLGVLSVCPNPLHSSCLGISAPSWKTGDRLLVHDAKGRLVSDLSGSVKDGEASWDGKGRAPGVYLLVYKSANQTRCLKIMNMR